MDIANLQDRLQAFADARDWNRFHSPKNLAMALTVEAAELQEILQWLTQEEAYNITSAQRAALADEVADIMIYLARFASIAGIDIDAAVEQKLVKNALKYPPTR